MLRAGTMGALRNMRVVPLVLAFDRVMCSAACGGFSQAKLWQCQRAQTKL